MDNTFAQQDAAAESCGEAVSEYLDSTEDTEGLQQALANDPTFRVLLCNLMEIVNDRLIGIEPRAKLLRERADRIEMHLREFVECRFFAAARTASEERAIARCEDRSAAA